MSLFPVVFSEHFSFLCNEVFSPDLHTNEVPAHQFLKSIHNITKGGKASALHHSTSFWRLEGVWTLALAHALHQPTTILSEYFMWSPQLRVQKYVWRATLLQGNK